MARTAHDDSAAGGQRNRPLRRFKPYRPKRLSNAITHDSGTGTVLAGENDNEFLSAVAAYGVVWTQTAGDAKCKLIQHGVSRQMPVRVVDPFKVIDVQNDDGEVSALTNMSRIFASNRLEDHPAIDQSGQHFP